MSRWNMWGYYSQPAESDIREKADQAVKNAAKKGQIFHPVVINGRTIAKNWWGREWCANLERYADYESRLSRGKKYVRAGAVIDLQIEEGRISAKVQGSRKKPYDVDVFIKPLSKQYCEQIIKRCGEKANNLDDLLNGSVPASMRDVFTDKNGLFPTPKEISFDCSCPDFAVMCKHIAAVLYGIGARLDEEPLLFFTLRGIDTSDFVDTVIANRIDAMLANADKRSKRIITETDISDIFGI